VWRTEAGVSSCTTVGEEIQKCPDVVAMQDKRAEGRFVCDQWSACDKGVRSRWAPEPPDSSHLKLSRTAQKLVAHSLARHAQPQTVRLARDSGRPAGCQQITSHSQTPSDWRLISIARVCSRYRRLPGWPTRKKGLSFCQIIAVEDVPPCASWATAPRYQGRSSSTLAGAACRKHPERRRTMTRHPSVFWIGR